jgi:hypothetical protein
MGTSKSSCQSSRVQKNCGRASEVWSGARSARLTLETRLIASRLNAPRVPQKTFLQKIIINVPLKRWAGLQLAVRASELTAVELWIYSILPPIRRELGTHPFALSRVMLPSQPPADERACPMSSIRNLSWPSQWRFHIPAQIHPKLKLTSQSVVIKKAHQKF